MNRGKTLLKNTFILSIGTFLPRLASFITLPILTGCLTAEELGTYDLITVLVSLLLPGVTLQVQTAAFRYLIDERDSQANASEIVSTVFAFIVPVAFVTLAVFWVFLPIRNSVIKLLVCGYYLADIVVNTTRQVARGLTYAREYTASAIISALGKMAFAIIFIWRMKLGLLGATISLFLSSLLSWAVLSFRIRLFHLLRFRAVSGSRLKTLLGYSWPMVPNQMSMWVMRLSDRLVITAFMGVSWNAVYTVANKIPSLLDLAQNSFTMAWQENASVVSKDSDVGAYYSSMFSVMF
ncbi:MAG: oligosaccharide flippase family protein, partial [Clostridia bacterium]|nr:oligosaccharide flippase family protein [Clostridia bacterium]